MRTRKPTRAEKIIIEAAGFESGSYTVVSNHNGLLVICGRSDERNIHRIDTNTKKEVPR